MNCRKLAFIFFSMKFLYLSPLLAHKKLSQCTSLQGTAEKSEFMTRVMLTQVKNVVASAKQNFRNKFLSQIDEPALQKSNSSQKSQQGSVQELESPEINKMSAEVFEQRESDFVKNVLRGMDQACSILAFKNIHNEQLGVGVKVGVKVKVSD